MTKPTSVIYVIANKKNGMVYIGKTVDKEGYHTRWKTHIRQLNNGKHRNPHLQNAWSKYGENTFSFQVLEYCTPETINERETHYIAIYKAKGKCYNVTNGGEGTPGRIVSEETRLKMSKLLKGRPTRPHTEEARQKIIAGLTNRPVSDETRQKLREAMKKRPPPSEETRRKQSEAKKGRPHIHSEETCRKLSESLQGHSVSNETRAKMSEGQKRRKARERQERQGAE